ncbi:Glutathione S-transferase [Rubellimicrobium mesophilum DSM 19309]|uniref:Glutathione S-transferase n=1 Tax=Rubellimicrobium mesophilum DSM 19309 TaxID=442562 RepID=A0A017HL20_9RHOB|nr:glutathione S-transferase family protein [Rubellimicrobium mesophilum]EYD75192.1 Glutathione S-transferase [Rubellimicrobium mesophilum DSM 19309]
MLTLYHSPRSRSTAILTLLAAMDALDRVEVREVSITRFDGQGAPDPRNPHPEGKVPLLVHDGVAIWERAAILLYLTDLFPESGLGVPAGDRLRGRYLSWLAWYAGVMEPVMIHDAAGLAHPFLSATFRGMAEMRDRLSTALAEGPWLVGDRYTAADLLCSSPYLWFRDLDPGCERIRDWVARCAAHPARAAALERDERALAA